MYISPVQKNTSLPQLQPRTNALSPDARGWTKQCSLQDQTSPSRHYLLRPLIG